MMKTNKVKIIYASNKKFQITNIVILSFFILITFILMILSTIYFAIKHDYDFLAFFILLNFSIISFLLFFFIYILNYGATLLNHYHKKINPSIKSGGYKTDKNKDKHFYKKFKPYIKLILKLQITMNSIAVISIFLLLVAFILLDVIFSLPKTISFDNYFIIFCICEFCLCLSIILYHHICKIFIKIRYKNKYWNYSILYSFLLSSTNQEINWLTYVDKDLETAKKFIIHIRQKYEEPDDISKENKDNLDKRFDILKNWTKIWISPLLVLLWSLFIVFIPTIAIWWLTMHEQSLNYNFSLMISFAILLIVVFYYYVSVCLFYFFIFNNFQLHRNEDEKDAMNSIKEIIFIPKDIQNSDKKINDLLSKTKLFFMLGILKKIFQSYDFNERNSRKRYFIYIKDKIYDLTEYDKVYISLNSKDGKIPVEKDFLELNIKFKDFKYLIVQYKFSNSQKISCNCKTNINITL